MKTGSDSGVFRVAGVVQGCTVVRVVGVPDCWSSQGHSQGCRVIACWFREGHSQVILMVRAGT